EGTFDIHLENDEVHVCSKGKKDIDGFYSCHQYKDSISERKLANRHSLTEADVSLAAMLLVSMPSPGSPMIFTSSMC
ncbi:hypothetical protein Tco_1429012, partial [Tanacetum coccineum]